MSYTKNISFLCAMCLLGGCGSSSDSTTTTTTPISSSDKLTINYTEDIQANISNPDRGFYDATYELEKNSSYNIFENTLSNGYTLVYASINLQEYNDTKVLPDEILNNITKNLSDANRSGIHMVFRIKYRSSVDSYDASKEIIMSHLSQLKPILQTYKDTISVVQAGLIGAWGEWHSFNGDFADTNSSYLSNRKDMLLAWSDIFPDKYIQIRTPMHKEQLLGAGGEYGDESTEGEITQDIAFSDDIRAKVGYHNDCFLSNQTDMGTYSQDDIEFWKSYVANDTLYAPIGGESCGIGDDEDAKLSDCDNALEELKTMRYSFLNDVYHPDVLSKWKEQGCYDIIKYNLGYRIVADKLEVEKGDNRLDISLSLTNKGYAPPYINYPVKFILKSMNHEYLFVNETDTREWYPNSTQTLSQHITYDKEDDEKYCLYIQIGKTDAFVRLSNKDIWDESLKANKLLCDI